MVRDLHLGAVLQCDRAVVGAYQNAVRGHAHIGFRARGTVLHGAGKRLFGVLLIAERIAAVGDEFHVFLRRRIRAENGMEQGYEGKKKERDLLHGISLRNIIGII